jgi:hypothetical protein
VEAADLTAARTGDELAFSEQPSDPQRLAGTFTRFGLPEQLS